MRAYAQSSQYHTIARESCSSNRMNEPILHPKNEMSIKYLKNWCWFVRKFLKDSKNICIYFGDDTWKKRIYLWRERKMGLKKREKERKTEKIFG